MRYWFDVTCGRCGGEVRHVTSGQSPTTSSAVIVCEDCRTEWVIRAELLVSIDHPRMRSGDHRVNRDRIAAQSTDSGRRWRQRQAAVVDG